MANKPAARKTTKPIKEEKSKRWLKIGLADMVLVFIMVMVTLQAFFSQGSIDGGSADTGKGKFNSIGDALKDHARRTPSTSGTRTSTPAALSAAG